MFVCVCPCHARIHSSPVDVCRYCCHCDELFQVVSGEAAVTSFSTTFAEPRLAGPHTPLHVPWPLPFHDVHNNVAVVVFANGTDSLASGKVCDGMVELR